MSLMLLALFSVCRVLLLVFVDDLVALLDLVLDPVEGLRGHEGEATLQLLEMEVLLGLAEGDELATVLFIVFVGFSIWGFIPISFERRKL